MPEKRHLDLILAFNNAELSGWKLVLVGGSDHPDSYTRQILELSRSSLNIVCTGFKSGLALQELYTHAGMFVLPSSHEGLPIALLEALSFGLPVIASNIPANLEVGLPADHYFPLGDIEALKTLLISLASSPFSLADCESRRNWVAMRFNWEVIAKQTKLAYDSIAENKKPLQNPHD